MTRRFRTGATRGQINTARGIAPKDDFTPDSRDRPRSSSGPQYRRYTLEVPPDHIEWARTRYLYPYVPTAPVSAVYPFAAVSGRFNLRNGWVVGTL